MKIDRITFTGADDQTDITSLQTLNNQFPLIEWGILFSKGRDGSSRYPSSEWINSLKGHSMNLSAHFCGWYAKSILEHQQFNLIDNLDPQFARIQLNYNFSKSTGYHLTSLLNYAVSHPERSFIFQYNKSNKDVLYNLRVIGLPENIHFLFDASGGRGTEIREIESPLGNSYTGYAGGINPTNAASIIEAIQMHPIQKDVWIDMESGVRDEQDQFSLEMIQQILNIAIA